MFTLTVVDLDIWHQCFYFGIWNDDRTKIIVLQSIQLVTRINLQNRNENEFINVLWHIILYKNIGNSIWYYWSFDPTNMKFFILIQLLTRFPTSKYLILFSSYLVWRNEAMWKICFSAPQNAKKGNQLKHKTKCITYFLLIVRSSRMKDYSCHYEVST